MKKLAYLPFLVIMLAVGFFFQSFFVQHKLPIPADTIVGLYHPFRDFYVQSYPNGIPYKNALVTDPVRQQYPWKYLAITEQKQFSLPLWNPYAFSGTPLLATMQGGIFYPLNIFFFLFAFSIAWSLFIIIQPLLAGTFLYLYLRNLHLTRLSSLFGSVTYAFCGFAIAWLEWGTVGHVTMWLPLALLSIDRIFSSYAYSNALEFDEESKRIKNRRIILWFLLYIFSCLAAFYAGHLQTFFYLFLFVWCYFFARWIQFGKTHKLLSLFILVNVLFVALTIIQWLPTIRFIAESARSIDLNWYKDGWFIPWQHLIQFIAPDFFGNPATLNYWGVWNYGELVGYVSIAPLIFALLALFYRHDKKTLFFGTMFFLSLLFALPTIFAKIPFLLEIPFLSTAQPTRLLFITDFCLAVLAAFGCEYYFRITKKKYIFAPILFVGFVLVSLWLFVLSGSEILGVTLEQLTIAKRNIMLPSIIFLLSLVIVMAAFFVRNKKVNWFLVSLLICITLFDLIRFGQKFTPFSDAAYLFPETRTIEFLQKNSGEYRLMTTDDRILPPNFSLMYKLQSVDGYDPLYLRRYGEFIAAIERGKPDISPPFGFNRIITPHQVTSPLIDLLGVKYVMSLSDETATNLKEVFREGETRVYENTAVFPRAFFVSEIFQVKERQQAIDFLFAEQNSLQEKAVIEIAEPVNQTKYGTGSAKITKYETNRVELTVQTKGEGFLILTDNFYPTWQAYICSKTEEECLKTVIYRTDYLFRGIVVPSGEHDIIFINSLL